MMLLFCGFKMVEINVYEGRVPVHAPLPKGEPDIGKQCWDPARKAFEAGDWTLLPEGPLREVYQSIHDEHKDHPEDLCPQGGPCSVAEAGSDESAL